MKFYSLVAKAWSLIFLIVGLLFLFIPKPLGQTLMDLGNVFGLTGIVTTSPNSLWYILTFSLMGALAVLAYYSAKKPETKPLYITILIAKTISVIGFIGLSITIGSVWLLCAGADAFVAITLILAYPKFVLNMAPGFAKVKAKSPHYEVWYGKIDIAPNQAFWFRYTIIDGVKQEASTWSILFKNGEVKTGKNTWPLADLSPANIVIIPNASQPERYSGMPQVFHLGKNHLDGANAIGSAGNISWDMTFTDSGNHFEHIPVSVKLLGIAKSNYHACFLDSKFSGSIKIGSDILNFENRPGMIGHIHGKRSARNWAWAHCNNFEGEDNIIFEGLSAKIKDSGALSMPLTSIILFTPQKKYIFSSLTKLIKNKSTYGDGKWEFEARNKDVVLKGVATSPNNIALVEYTDTDDSNLWCYNSKLANLTLELTDLKSNTTQTFKANQTCAFELVNRIKPSEKIDL